jgi:RimJ/RimL family protein N-acetyltransferase
VERLNLVEHSSQLFAAFHRAPNDDDWDYLPYGPFESQPAFDAWLTDVAIKTDPLFHAIIDLKTNTTTGLASLMRIDPANGVIEVGHIHFSPMLKHTTAATEALTLLMRRVFDELGYRRLEWKCNAQNQKSRNAAVRLGFTYEGTFRQAAVVKGRNRDTAWYSMLDGEWPTIKAAHSAWLDPTNFDANGAQYQSLRHAKSD